MYYNKTMAYRLVAGTKCRDGYYIIKYHNRVNMALKEVPCFPEVKKILTMVEKRW